MGRRDGPPKASRSSAVPLGQRLMEEAETLQQQGERQKGRAAADKFETAAAKFDAALQAGLPDDQAMDARFGLAECLQLRADALLEATQKLPDEQLTQDAESQANATACALYRQSAEMYKQVMQDGQIRVDAAVCCGNALCSAAEVLTKEGGEQLQPACQMLQEAVSMYRHALTLEQDALTLSNLGDALIQAAELCAQLSQPEDCTSAYTQALQAYEQSCSMTDSSAGDDLPGLLCNWGTGLLAISSLLQEPAAKQQALQQAAQKLQDAASFDRGDTAPLTGLGDVLAAQADVAMAVADSSSDSSSRLAAVSFLQQALERGYAQALTINRNNADALVGCAEVHCSLAKLARLHGDASAAQQHLTQSVHFYKQALQTPSHLGGFSDRCDVRYNHACTLALSGDEAAAAQLLHQLLMCRGASMSVMLQDPDLMSFHDRQWWQQLLASVSAT